MVNKQKRLTVEGQQTLQGELDNLVSVRRREVAARIHKANETGGTVDNAEYEDAKYEQAFVEGRISDLENILANAVVESGGRKSAGSVEFGSTVIVSPDGGAKKLYKVVGSAEAAPLEGKISVESPVGQALMGHKVGDKVKVTTPSGEVTLAIVKIK